MTNIRNVRRNIVIRYAAPALEKGLDVLELLASETHSLRLQEIAARVSIPATRGALK